MKNVIPRFGACVEVGEIAAIFSGEVRNADFHFADGFRRRLEAAATDVVLVRVHSVDIVSIVA